MNDVIFGIKKVIDNRVCVDIDRGFELVYCIFLLCLVS